MVQIAAPTLPLRLYRYRPLHSKDTNEISQEKLKRELKAICENYLWCSPFEKLNDPMEGTFGLTPTAVRASDAELFLKEVRNVMGQMGVCCFSDTHENDVCGFTMLENIAAFAWNTALTT